MATMGTLSGGVLLPVSFFALCSAALGLLKLRRVLQLRLLEADPGKGPRPTGVTGAGVYINGSGDGSLWPIPRTISRQRLTSNSNSSSEMAKLIPSHRQRQNLISFQSMERRIVLCMVGLPARGKSYIVKMLVRYLSWMGYESKLFNVGELRRKLTLGGKSLTGVDASFFQASLSVTLTLNLGLGP